jgi:hypothetical protein
MVDFSAYDGIVYRIHSINNEPFFRRWLMGTPIADELRDLSAKAEKLYQLYLVSPLVPLKQVSSHTVNRSRSR